MPSRKEFPSLKGNMSSLNRARTFCLLSWTLRSGKSRMRGNNQVWETSDCGGAWKQFVFLTRIIGELDSRAVTEETLVMRKKHVHRQAEVVGKEDLCNQEGCGQPRG